LPCDLCCDVRPVVLACRWRGFATRKLSFHVEANKMSLFWQWVLFLTGLVVVFQVTGNSIPLIG